MPLYSIIFMSPVQVRENPTISPSLSTAIQMKHSLKV